VKKKKLVLSKNPDVVKRKIKSVEAQIKKWGVKMTEKDELKTVALGTSKINYLDPRITAAWCKRNEVPIEKIFSKALRDKFPWAMNPPKDWSYVPEK